MQKTNKPFKTKAKSLFPQKKHSFLSFRSPGRPLLNLRSHLFQKVKYGKSHVQTTIEMFISSTPDFLGMAGHGLSYRPFSTWIHKIPLGMELFLSIKQMRHLSKENIPFSFAFMSYNSTKQSSDGVIYVRRARLLKREKIENHKYAECVEAYIDLDTMQCRRFYQPLLMFFNGEKISLK